MKTFICTKFKKLFRLFLEIAPLYKKQNSLISKTGFLSYRRILTVESFPHDFFRRPPSQKHFYLKNDLTEEHVNQKYTAALNFITYHGQEASDFATKITVYLLLGLMETFCHSVLFDYSIIP